MRQEIVCGGLMVVLFGFFIASAGWHIIYTMPNPDETTSLTIVNLTGGIGIFLIIAGLILFCVGATTSARKPQQQQQVVNISQTALITPSDAKFCSVCGKPLKSQAKFCDNCGPQQ